MNFQTLGAYAKFKRNSVDIKLRNEEQANAYAYTTRKKSLVVRLILIVDLDHEFQSSQCSC